MKGKLHIQTRRHSHRSYLKTAYGTPPFKVANVTEDASKEILQLMLMNSSPGVLDGDEYHMKIEIGERSSLKLQTQSYQRLYQMTKGASQKMEVFLSDQSSFCYIPHPVVPHKNSFFSSRNRIHLSDQCSLIWGEVVTCGRRLNDEIFRFTHYHNKTEIFCGEKLIVKDNLLLQPGNRLITGMGQMEGYTHQASLIIINEETNMDEFYSGIDRLLSKEEGISYGVSALAVSGCMVRILGYKAEQLYNCLQSIAQFIERTKITNKLPGSSISLAYAI